MTIKVIIQAKLLLKVKILFDISNAAFFQSNRSTAYYIIKQSCPGLTFYKLLIHHTCSLEDAYKDRWKVQSWDQTTHAIADEVNQPQADATDMQVVISGIRKQVEQAIEIKIKQSSSMAFISEPASSFLPLIPRLISLYDRL